MINTKPVLLVMGGFAQICDIVQHAKEKGIYVIVTDYLQDSPAKRIADESYMISISDVDRIVNLCKERSVDGVMNYCIDPGQKPYQQICEKLGLSCYGTKEQFDILTNKDLFYDACLKNNVGVVPRYNLQVDCNMSQLSGVEFPIVVKPADGRASRGITICTDEKEVPHAIEKALSFSNRKRVIFEKYMNRPEVCVKYFVSEGEIALTSMADLHSYFVNGRRVYFSGQSFPSKYYKEYLETTDQTVRQMIRNLGIKNGPLSFSGFYDKGVFRFVDPSFRMGGAQDWRIVEKTTGVDISACLTNFAITGSMCGKDSIKRVDGKFADRYSSIMYYLVKPGRIGKITGLEGILGVESVIGYHNNHVEGDVITREGTSDHVAVRILLVADSKTEIEKSAQKISSLISIVDDKGEDMILNKNHVLF